MTKNEEDQMIISRRLIEMRKAMIGMLVARYGLDPHDAEDVYSEVTEYILRVGAEKLDIRGGKEFGGAITNLSRNRALNHIRNRRRIVHGWFSTWETSEVTADKDGPELWDLKLDHTIHIKDILNSLEDPSHRPMIEAILEGEPVNVVARQHGINKHTLAGMWRRMRNRMRKHYEQEAI